jgi:hypothetical protein
MTSTMTKNDNKMLPDSSPMEETLPPMSVEEMQIFLTEIQGKPIVLRHEGETEIKCPYCGNLHTHSLWDAGHVEALCEDRDIEITINGRAFIPNYGYTIYEYTPSNDNTCFKLIGDPL